MLKGISPAISPELLKVLSEMGHGDEIVFADAHFPGHSMNSRVLRADGVGVDTLLKGLIPLFELDSYAPPLIMMAPVAGDELDSAIISYMKRAYNLLIGERTAEEIKIKVGSAVPLKDELDVEVNGRDVITGLPKTVRIESEEIRRALNKPLDEMAKAVKDALDATPPDLASDLMYYGILLTGGGALLRGLDVRLRDETGVSVNVSPTALDNVVNGCARVLEANAFDGGFVQTNA